MEDLEQAFVEYASSGTDEARGKWYSFKPEQNNFGDTYNPSWKSHPNLRLSKFKFGFKQQQSEMTNKIDTVLKAITDRLAGSLPSDTVKNPKLSTSLVFSARSYPTIDPPMLITPLHFNQRHQNMFHGGEHFPDKPAANRDGDWTQQPEEPKPTLEDEFQDLHLNLPVLKT
nr:MAK10-like protein [Tanacetum cinerariifolium]